MQIKKSHIIVPGCVYFALNVGLCSLAHVGRVGLVRLQAKELRNFHRPKPQVCGSEWGGVLGEVKNVATSVGCQVGVRA